MKKVLAITFALTVILASCSKERKLNRKMDGEWNTSTVNGTAPTAGNSMVIAFDKDKKDDGSVTMTTTTASPASTTTRNGKYALTKDEAISITFTDGNMDVWTVTDYSKDEMTVTSYSSTTGLTTIVLKKK